MCHETTSIIHIIVLLFMYQIIKFLPSHNFPAIAFQLICLIVLVNNVVRKMMTPKFRVTNKSNQLNLMIIYFCKHIIIANININNSFTLHLGYLN